jgi:hypothetical protein
VLCLLIWFLLTHPSLSFGAVPLPHQSLAQSILLGNAGRCPALGILGEAHPQADIVVESWWTCSKEGWNYRGCQCHRVQVHHLAQVESVMRTPCEVLDVAFRLLCASLKCCELVSRVLAFISKGTGSWGSWLICEPKLV